MEGKGTSIRKSDKAQWNLDNFIWQQCLILSLGHWGLRSKGFVVSWESPFPHGSKHSANIENVVLEHSI